jgi:capsular exopolysaccharide synthesis family protein
LAEAYQQKINVVSAGANSNIIKFSLQDPIALKAEDILNSLINNYNKDVTEQQAEVVKVTSDFINNRLQMVSAELSQVDLTAETIKQDNRLTDLSNQTNLFLQSEQENKARLNETSNQLQLVDYMDNFLKENNDTGDLLPANIGITDASYAELTRRHNELVLTRNRILENSSLKNPTVVNLDEQINNIKQSLSNSLNNIKTSNQITYNSLSQEDSRISSKIYSAPRKERQFRDIQRQQQIKESIYLYLLEKREESAISLGVSQPNANVIDYAKSFSLPVSPSKKVAYIAALFLGLLIPIVIIYIADLLDTKIHTPEQLKRLTKIPFLGDIPKSKTKNALVKKVDYTPKAEAFRLVRTNIDFLLSSMPKDEGKVIFVTSTTSQEGKSHTSINLSKSLSYSDKKVLLIETDIRVPKANKYLEIDSKIGLTDYLVNDNMDLSDAITKIDDNFDVITSGTIPPNPAELLMSDKMVSIFKTVKDNYDYIIVDTAAVGLVTDTLILGNNADMVLYVVRANYLDKAQLSIAETLYNEKRLPNMTVLLNAVKSKKGYGYGYGNNPKKKKK